MSKIEDALWEDYQSVSSIIKNDNPQDERYKEVLEERDKIRNELIKVEQINQEKSVKMIQLDNDNKKDIIHNGITIGTFVISIGASLVTVWKSFKFDEKYTMTSTLGRGIIHGWIPKIFKK